MINKKELIDLLGKAEKIFIDNNKRAKDCILTFLFFKYLNDIYYENVQRIEKEFAGDERAIKGKISRFPPKFYPDSMFSYYYKNRKDANIVKLVKSGLKKFKENHKNDAWLSSVFTAINLDYVADGYIDSLDTGIMVKLLEFFNDYDLSGKEDYDLFSTAFEYFYEWKYTFQSFREYIGM